VPVRVSVIVPVFNPGPSFDELIGSFDAQTMASTDFEVLLCDDGSDETTHERLENLERTRPYVRVLWLPHSGWPGTPRNHGIAEARGTYVQFVDQDDRLFPGALQKLCDYADRHSSDVIVGKEVGIGRPLPRRIFSRDIPDARLGEDPILELLTPHKMFRTAFLRDNDIHFPNGRVRLEDHLFVMEAYFKATTISVLASEPCYAWIKHPGSASSSRIEPETYFPHLEAVLDLVEQNTEPGKLRDRLLRHWFRGKILKRLSGRQMVRYPDDYRQRFIDVVRPLAERRFGPGVDAGLAFPNRIRAALLRADRRSDLLQFAQFENDVECRAELTSAAWTRGGGLLLGVRVSITHDGEPALVLEPSESAPKRTVWRAPRWLDNLPAPTLDATRDARGDQIEVTVSDDRSTELRHIASRRAVRKTSVTIPVDPLRVFRAEDAALESALSVRVRRAGWTFDVPLTADRAVLANVGRSPVLAGRAVTVEVGDDGTVSLKRGRSSGAWKDAIGRSARRVRSAVRRK
jgi:glycosyltransferase involved in cell wall biosynthesis